VDRPGIAPEQRLAVAQNFAEKKGTVFVVFRKAAMNDAGWFQACAGKSSATCALVGTIKGAVAVKCLS